MGRAFRWSVLAALVAAALTGPGRSHGSVLPCDPTLKIVSPVAGQTVRTPFPIRYRVRCFKLGQAPNGHIELRLASPSPISIALRAGTSPGVSIVPRNPFLAGRRTLVFQLTRARGTPLTSPRATVRLALQIVGSR